MRLLFEQKALVGLRVVYQHVLRFSYFGNENAL